VTNAQLIMLILTILGSNFAVLLYLSNRVDRSESVLTARVDRVGDKLELINKELGRHESEMNPARLLQ
jgi:hypothetical protein